jgi:hypothetical protein
MKTTTRSLRRLLLLSALGALTLGTTTAFAQAEKPLRHADKNHHGPKEGGLTREKALERAGKRFDAADRNDDGKLNREEKVAARKKYQETKGERIDKRKERRDERNAGRETGATVQ